MQQEIIFAVISTVIYLIGVIPYWKDVLSWRTIPHIFSIWVWFILTSFNCYVLWLSREWLSFIPSIIMNISLIFSIFYWVKMFKLIRINWFDYMCLFLAWLLLIYYSISQNIFNTVILTIIIDFIAFLPTFKKGWLQPWTESIFIYLLAWINQIFTFLALSSPNLETSLFWLYIFFANIIFYCMVFFRRWYLRGWASISE